MPTPGTVPPASAGAQCAPHHPHHRGAAASNAPPNATSAGNNSAGTGSPQPNAACQDSLVTSTLEGAHRANHR